MLHTKIGFIGFGSMGSSLCEGWLKAKALSKEQIFFTRKHVDKALQIEKKMGIQFLLLKDLIATADVLFFCIEPQSLSEVLHAMQKIPHEKKLFVTVVSGAPFSTYQQFLGEDIALIRAMPNTPVQLLEGMTALAALKKVSASQLSFIKHLFASLGGVEVVKEDQINTAVGLSGSSPALFFKIAESFIKIGVAEGLAPDVSQRFIAQTLIGAGSMLKYQDKTPQELVSEIAVRGGSTEKGLQVFNDSQLGHALENVVNTFIAHARGKKHD